MYFSSCGCCHPFLIVKPTTYHVNNTCYLKHEKRSIISHICVSSVEEVDQPNVKESLATRAHTEFQLRTEIFILENFVVISYLTQ